MKREKLQDAIGMIGDDLIRDAENQSCAPSKASRIKWISLIAAMLSFVIVLGVVLRPNKPEIIGIEEDTELSQNISGSLNTDLGKFVFAKAQYPERCQNIAILGDSAAFDDSVNETYDRWLEERNEYWGAYNERTPELGNFIKNSIPAFLGNTEGNAIYSPVNVYMALALLGETSDGESREQILDALGCESVEEMRTDANAVWKALYTDDGASKTILANSVWLRDDSEYNKSTLDLLASDYYASSYRGKMGSDEYNKALQSWLNEQTDDMLTDQVKGLGMEPETTFALASTLLYNAKWADEFNPEFTETGIFHSSVGDTECEFMKDSNTGYLFMGEEFTAVCRNFAENGGHMMFVLPNEGTTPEELAVSDEFGDLVNCGGRDSGMKEYTDKTCWENDERAIINLSVPKFDVSSQLRLNEGLGKLGITDITDETKADFSPITNDPAFLDEMIHGARVTVDEKGCSAASYVLSLCGATSAPLKTVDFTLDRPFIFIIAGYDGLPLYIGIVNNI